jgi:uncharacterized membrane protein YqjE
MSEGDGVQGPATNLLRSVVQLGGTLLAVVQTRVELLSTEIGEDIQLGARILLWAALALLSGIMGAMLVGITVIVYFWDTHRLAAAVCVTAAFLSVAIVAGLVCRRRLHETPRLLDATREELSRDVSVLRSDR